MPIDTHIEGESQIKPLNEKGVSRRKFLKLLGLTASLTTLGAVSGEGLNFALNPAARADADLILRRRTTREGEYYIPPDLEDFLPKDYSDQVFDSLKLDKRSPNTITKETFYKISQKVARLASFYFEPNPSLDKTHQQEEFGKHCVKFFGQMMNYTDEMKVDFVATLLTWQNSGENTSSFQAQKDDLRDENIRALLSFTEKLSGVETSGMLISLMRRLNVNSYYQMPRLESGSTLGIHDIEIVMIIRGLLDLKQTRPDYWPKIEKVLQRFPNFNNQYQSYADKYAEFDQQSDKISEDVNGSVEVQQYLSGFKNESVLKALTTTNNQVDDYQFMRTTTFWANVCNLQSKTSLGAYVAASWELEQQALAVAIKQYLLAPTASAIFFDQIGNPKMLAKLEQDAQMGNATAERLLATAKKFNSDGDRLNKQDRLISAALIDDGTEQDMEFQLVTGTAYSKWLLKNAYRHTHPDSDGMDKIAFNSPGEVAYHAFLACANRENGTVFQLAGSGPLHGMTLPFLPSAQMYAVMDRFVKDVYRQFEQKAPQDDFATFIRYFTNMFEEAYIPSLIGINRYLINDDEKTGEFIQAAEKHGVYKNIITPPHCSWIRALSATAPYITLMRNKQ